ncbi:MAG: hypothetical protein A2W26_06300 [Acidobacteria bacterium RBG_16_64_8]|nr:MAG: hypothetical protein A2W26_06300 [Acidobacteria bacterium RBG_16_64_8]
MSAMLPPMVVCALAAIAERAHAGASVLDAGCGDGDMTSIFTSAGLRCVGLDRSIPTTRGPAAHNAQCVFACARVEHLPFADQSFDIVYIGSVLQYADRPLASRETARILRRGGLLVATENLHGTPVARLARLDMRLARHRHPPHLTPKHHLRRRELSLYATHLRAVTGRAFNLLTPSLYVADCLAKRLSGGLAARANWYRYVHAMDRRLLVSMPALEHLAWNIVVCADK